MKLFILTSYILTLQVFGIIADTDIHRNAHPNVIRVSLGGNTQQRPKHRSQLLRQSVPISPTNITTALTQTLATTTTEATTTTTNTMEGDNLSCSQTVHVTSESTSQYHFVVSNHNAASLHCVITIFGQRGKQLLLQVIEADLQPGLFDCEIDSVQVYTLSAGKLSFKDKFCNLSQPGPEILTKNNVAVLTFNSDSQLNEPGFVIEVRSLLLPEENINNGYIDTGYSYGTGSYTGYPIDYNSYGPPTYNDYANRYTNISYTNYSPPNKGYANGYFNVTHNSNDMPQYAHYGPPVKTNYQNADDCNKAAWKITDKPEIDYGAYLPPKAHLNKDFYVWLTSATKGNSWSKELN